MKDLITEARELIEALHAGVYDDEYIGTGAYLMLDELCDALEKAEEQNKQLLHELCKLACESVERDRALAKLETEVMAACNSVRWVPVSERLPETSGAYWVNLHQEDEDGNDADFCVEAWYQVNSLLFAPKEVGWQLLNEWYEFSGQMRQYISHWMPLPAAPTKTKGE